MKLTQRSVVPLDRERLWDFLMDIPSVGRCIPGAEEIQPLEDGAYRGLLRVHVGPIRLALGGTITIEERDKNAWRASMWAEANDRKAAGGVRARMTMTLLPAAGGTELVVETDLSVLGKIGEFGQPFIRKKADGIMQEFAANLEAALKV